MGRFSFVQFQKTLDFLTLNSLLIQYEILFLVKVYLECFPIRRCKISVKVTLKFFVIFFFMPQKDKGKNVSVTSPFTGFPYVYLKNSQWFFFTFSIDMIKIAHEYYFQQHTLAIQLKRITFLKILSLQIFKTNHSQENPQ